MSCCTLEAPETARWNQTPVTLLLATDFDGTVAPIVADPQEAVLHESARRLLWSCAERPSIALAVLSGRDVEDVRRRLGGLRAFVSGSHGLECMDPDGRILWSTPLGSPEIDPKLIEELEAAGLRIERKKFSMAVHFRDHAPAHLDALLEHFTDWARSEKLEVVPGRMVVEARVAGGGKRSALRKIAMRTYARRVVYAGDDTTDFEALALASELGRAIFVGSSERCPPDVSPLHLVRTIEDLCDTLVREIER